MRSIRFLGLAALAAALAGCNVTGAMTPPEAIPPVTLPAKRTVAPAAEAGIGVTAIAAPDRLKGALAMRDGAGPARPDPFALTTAERYFETQQTEERIFGESGGFSVQVTPKPEEEVLVAPPEPQPYRRLSGVVVGDSVLAILIEQGRPGEGDGQGIVIHPGMQIPNSPWRVLSIDQEKAVLVRSGKALPTQVIVRLETPPPGMESGPPQGGLSGPGGLGGAGGGGRGGPGGRGAPGGAPSFGPNGGD